MDRGAMKHLIAWKNAMKYNRRAPIRSHPAWIAVLIIFLIGGIVAVYGTVNQKETINAPIDSLIHSVEYSDHQIRFQIPSGFPHPENLNLHIAGRAVYEDGFSKSLHFLEAENEAKSWEAGSAYSIPFDSNETELTMDITYPQADGTIFETTIDLLQLEGLPSDH